ncbi:hypothetical protein K474DRAFT_1645470 [Panus rudis PR-1116 ss-1]|nr:hypothetical protein K474DRAFT_1645470 [Panus rudis PR-1116 ss-1]
MASEQGDRTPNGEQPHLVSLVLQSKKALQHGEQLCSKARSLSSASGETAGDVLALDAKLKWMTKSVIQQLKLAAGVAKSIELKRNLLEKQAQEWDKLRAKRTDELDTILDSLSRQVVPPDFHSNSAESSIFGSQDGSDEERDDARTPLQQDPGPSQSPTETLRNVLRNGVHKQRSARANDRSRWKTLRDFVDEHAIEDLLEGLESDRNALDDILARTSDYPESLFRTIAAIEEALPDDITPPAMDAIFTSQETVLAEMAVHLTSLIEHYGKMADALHDTEAGEQYSEEDLQAMNRDMEELPAIIADLERSTASIQSSHEQLLSAKQQAQEQLSTLRRALTDLDELGDIMTEMLGRQEEIEHEVTEQLKLLHENLIQVEDLYHRYTSYQYSFNMLIREMARRNLYKEAAEKVVQGMMHQLSAMTEEERVRREQFNADHGPFLPRDVCLFIENPPNRWEILPYNNEPLEVLPDIPSDILAEASNRVNSAADNALSTSPSQSL